jgi:hypothetical protein
MPTAMGHHRWLGRSAARILPQTISIDLDRSFVSFNPKIDLFADIKFHCQARPPLTCAHALLTLAKRKNQDAAHHERSFKKSKCSKRIKMLLKLFKKFTNASS